MVGAVSPPILDTLDIRFEFRGYGWATCHLRSGEWQHSIEWFSDSYVDTFVDFLLAAVADDAGSFQTASVAFEFEPGHALMEISPEWDATTNTAYASLRARAYPHDLYAATPRDEPGAELFDVRVKRGLFAQAVRKAFCGFAENPETHFEPNWGFPFPSKAHGALMASLGTENRAKREPKGDRVIIKVLPEEDHD